MDDFPPRCLAVVEKPKIYQHTLHKSHLSENYVAISSRSVTSSAETLETSQFQIQYTQKNIPHGRKKKTSNRKAHKEVTLTTGQLRWQRKSRHFATPPSRTARSTCAPSRPWWAASGSHPSPSARACPWTGQCPWCPCGSRACTPPSSHRRAWDPSGSWSTRNLITGRWKRDVNATIVKDVKMKCTHKIVQLS